MGFFKWQEECFGPLQQNSINIEQLKQRSLFDSQEICIYTRSLQYWNAICPWTKSLTWTCTFQRFCFCSEDTLSYPNLKDGVFPLISFAIPIKHGFSSIIVIILYGSGCFSSYIAIILTLVFSISLLFLLAMLLFLNITSSSVKTFLRNIADGFLIS